MLAIVLRPDLSKVDPRLLHSLLLSQIMLDLVVQLQSGTSLPRVSHEKILSAMLPIPDSLSEQWQVSKDIEKQRSEAKRLREDADGLVAEAKVERMILGEQE